MQERKTNYFPVVAVGRSERRSRLVCCTKVLDPWHQSVRRCLRRRHSNSEHALFLQSPLYRDDMPDNERLALAWPVMVKGFSEIGSLPDREKDFSNGAR
jgi:hypothetical protein